MRFEIMFLTKNCTDRRIFPALIFSNSYFCTVNFQKNGGGPRNFGRINNRIMKYSG